uniref:Uncharacterized protein n=1 Tax=Arundo donax TaxID=35708 RepID=A0A0A9BIQ8_ARUDO
MLMWQLDLVVCPPKSNFNILKYL